MPEASLGLVEQLFPFFCTVDRQSRIVTAGPSLSKLLGPAAEGTSLTEHVSADPLFGGLDWESLHRSIGRLFVARHEASGLRLRGQVLALPGASALLIAWSPWVSSTEEFQAAGLSMLDFGIQDPTLDILHLLEAFDRARAEAAEPLDRLRRFFSTSPDLMVVLSATGRILMANDASAESLGVSPRDLTGQHFEALLTPDSRLVLAETLDRVHEVGSVSDVDIALEVHGEPRVLRLSAAGDAQNGQVFVIARDLSLAEELRQTAARILDTAPNAMLTVDRSGTITYANAEACAMFGYDKAILEGMGIESLVPDAVRDRHARLRSSFTDSSDSEYRRHMAADRDVEGRTAEGKIVPLQVTLASIVMRGRPQTLASLIDIGARKQLESELLAARDSALELAAAKSAFLANTSHEIRTPLTSIMGLTELLLQTTLTEEQRDIVESARLAEGRLLAIVDDVLTFSRADAGRLQRDDAPFNPVELLEECARIIAPGARAKAVALTQRTLPATPAHVIGDREKLRTVVINLAANAVKFTEVGSIELTVGWDSGQLTFDVADTGPGIDPDQMPLLFEPFVQADASTTRRYGGSGLGLAIAQQMVSLLEGRIEVTTKPGEGSRFRVLVPMPAAASSQRQQPASPPVSGDELAGLRVLLVEDDKVNSTLIARLLGRLGASVDTAHDGLAALESLAASPVDVVLMDCQMPVLDGYETTRRLRRIEQSDDKRQRTTVIALTASALDEDRRRCLAAGMDDFLSKPVRLADLREALARYASRAADG